jgi:hypothetical protein
MVVQGITGEYRAVQGSKGQFRAVQGMSGCQRRKPHTTCKSTQR